MILRQLEWLDDFRVLNSDLIRRPQTALSQTPEFESSGETIEFKKGQKTKVEVMGDDNYRDIERNMNFTTNYDAKFRVLPFPLNPREAQFFALLDRQGDADRRVSHQTISEPEFVSEVYQIFGGPVEATDAFVTDRAQELRDRGWISNNIRDGYYTILEKPESSSKKTSP